MSNYTKTVNFATKDSLPTGNLAKIVKGAEINTEFDNIATAIATKADTATTGTVTSTSVVSANGFAGTVATATSTPAITLSTSVTGVLKGDGTAISAATSGTDYVAPIHNSMYVAATNSGNAYTVTLPTGVAYTAAAGDRLTWSVPVDNTGAATLSVVSSVSGTFGPITLTQGGTQISTAGTLSLFDIVDCVYNGTTWEVISTGYTIHGVLIVPSTGILTLTNGKTLSVTNTLTLSGTDSTTITFQGTDTYVGRTTTDTLTNKRITSRVGSTTSSATPTINTDNYDIYKLTAQTEAITSFTTNLSGTPTDGQVLIIEVTGTAARAITWGTSFEASTVALPTTTVTTAMLTVGFIWNAVTSKWRCVGVA